MPSGIIVNLQGFEPQALDILLQTYSEADILINKKNMPPIWYELNGKKHRYFPDFYIPKDHLIVEVKSEWTLNRYLECNEAKFKAVKEAGYDFKLMVL